LSEKEALSIILCLKAISLMGNSTMMKINSLDYIRQNVKAILQELPPSVELVAAAKQQTPEKLWQPSKLG